MFSKNTAEYRYNSDTDTTNNHINKYSNHKKSKYFIYIKALHKEDKYLTF